MARSQRGIGLVAWTALLGLWGIWGWGALPPDPETGQYIHPPFRDRQCLRCHDEATRIPKTQPTVASLCYTCHKSKGDAKYVHGPVGAGTCTECHTPHETPNEFLLKLPVTEICYKCHASFETPEWKHLHPPVARRRCVDCHSPHATPYRYQLHAERGEGLCFRCHAERKIKGVPIPHKPVAEGRCLECHQPHGSEHRRMARKNPSGSLCFTCHQEKEKQARGSRYPHLAASQDCTNCHNPMGSLYPRILRAPFTLAPRSPYTPESYALCFQCHRRDKIEEPRNPDTRFRKLETNLHYLHVVRGDGVSCLACHDVHGAEEVGLTRREPWNGVRLAVTVRGSAGSCVSSCHAERSYDRGIR